MKHKLLPLTLYYIDAMHVKYFSIGLLLAGLLLLDGTVLYGQEIQGENTEIQTDSTSVEEKRPFDKKVAAYFEQGFELAPQYDGQAGAFNFGFGGRYEKWLFGFFFAQSKGKTKNDPFFPRDYDLPHQHAGGFIGRQLIEGDKWGLQARVFTSFGDLVWQDKITDANIFEDRFFAIQPALQVTFLPTRITQLYAGVGYRKLEGLHLTQVKGTAYDGTTLSFGIRLGIFYQPPIAE